jgi:hypothetical protein
VLWIKGKPGAGKSTLMKYALRKSRELFKDHVIASYFFNARGTDLEKTPLGMFRSIVYQLIEKDSSAYGRFVVLFRDKQKKHAQWEWGERELEEYLLVESTKPHKQPLLFLIDALDECKEQDVRRVVSCLETLSSESARANVTLRICLSSRHYPTVRMRKTLELIVEQRAEHDKDIAIYIRDKLIEKNREIEAELLEKASGIFMWVVLVVAMLNQAFDDGKIEAMQEMLRELPRDLEEVFKTVLGKNMVNKHETILMLQCLLFCRRPIKPVELFSAALVGTVPQPLEPWDSSKLNSQTVHRRIINSSKGLIEVRKGGSTLQFIHESVNDFLLRNNRLRTLDSQLRQNPVGTSHDYLKECCLAYLSSMELPIQKERAKRSYPFLPYASKYIFYHAEIAQASGVCQKEFLYKLQSQSEVGSLLRIFHNLFSERTRASLIQMLAFEGCYELMKVLSQFKGFKANAQDGGYYGNALQAAAAGGHPKVVRLLVDSGADVNAEGGQFGYALQAAAWKGHRESVRILLAHGADVYARGGKYGNAHKAAYSTQIIKILDDAEKLCKQKPMRCIIL